ncbi:MAG: hypothetical protein A4E69_01876 [Syntrophus sp. PtaB.Bin138]|nr:MAG: hypothetical protein A4E69_01876 [Syntrophus sp. PtaB.Bin138]
MSSTNFNESSIYLTLDQRINVLCDKNTIDGKQLAKRIGISPQYLTDVRHGKKVKGNPIKFWKGIREHFPEWEMFLRGETNTPPGRARVSESVAKYGEKGRASAASGPCSDPRYDKLIDEITMIMNSNYAGIKEALAQNVREFAQAVRDKNEIEGLKKSQAKDHETILRLVEKMNHMEDYINQITHPGEPLTGTETDG